MLQGVLTPRFEPQFFFFFKIAVESRQRRQVVQDAIMSQGRNSHSSEPSFLVPDTVRLPKASQSALLLVMTIAEPPVSAETVPSDTKISNNESWPVRLCGVAEGLKQGTDAVKRTVNEAEQSPSNDYAVLGSYS